MSVATLAFLVACSIPKTTAIVYRGSLFRVIATTAYTGDFVSDSTTTPISGSTNQDISFTAASGHNYSLTVRKSVDDGSTLTVELIANQTVDGTKTSIIVDSDSTTTTNTVARVALSE